MFGFSSLIYVGLSVLFTEKSERIKRKNLIAGAGSGADLERAIAYFPVPEGPGDVGQTDWTGLDWKAVQNKLLGHRVTCLCLCVGLCSISVGSRRSPQHPT